MTDFIVETKPANAQFTLAYWFVTKFLKRKWTAEDAKGRHFRHAQILLKEYSSDQIKGCLLAMRDGRINAGKFTIQWLIDVRNGEPPFMAQYRKLAETPPPQWMRTSYREWAKEFDPHWTPPTEEETTCPPAFPPPTFQSSARLHMARPRR
jgi:hypothetical protein